MKENQDYHQLISRNVGIIDEKTQRKILGSRLLIAGCGLGSNVAELAVRTGFQKLRLVDGDAVTPSNTNRQIFTLRDIGENKARALSTHLMNINRQISLDVVDRFVTEKDVDWMIRSCDFIINTLDYGEAFITLTEKGRKNLKAVVVPFNVAFGTLMIIFTKNSGSMLDLVENLSRSADNKTFYHHLYYRVIDRLPRYLVRSSNELFKIIDSKGYSPQIGIASNLTASAVISVVISILEKRSVNISPEVIAIDLKYV